MRTLSRFISSSLLPQLRHGMIGFSSIVLVLSGVQMASPAQAVAPAACPSGTYQVYGISGAVVIDSRNLCAVALDAAGSANWIVPPEVTLIEAVIVGGGGGGGAAGHFGITTGYLSGGGGGGGEAKFQSLNVTPGQTIKVSIGAGGSDGKYVDSGAKSGDGGDGGNTTVIHNGQTYTANGGGGGKSGDNGGAGGASGSGNVGGLQTIVTNSISPAPVVLGAGGGGGGAAQGATGIGYAGVVGGGGNTQSALGGTGGTCWTPPIANSSYFKTSQFASANNYYAAAAACLGLGGGGGTYLAQPSDYVAVGRVPAGTTWAQANSGGRSAQSSTCSWPLRTTRTAPMAATLAGTGYALNPTSGFASGSGSGGHCESQNVLLKAVGAPGLLWMRFLAPTNPVAVVTGKAEGYEYSPNKTVVTPDVESNPASTFTSQPTCNVFASTDTSYATPLSGSVLTPGVYVTHCSGGAVAGSSLWYRDTSFAVTRPRLTVALNSVSNTGQLTPVTSYWNSAIPTSANVSVVIGSEVSTQTVTFTGKSGPMSYTVNPADKANCAFEASSDPANQTGTIFFLQPGSCRLTISQVAGSGFSVGDSTSIWVDIKAFDSSLPGAVDPATSQTPDAGSGTIDAAYTDVSTKNPDTSPAVVVNFGAAASINAGGGVAMGYKASKGEITPSVLTGYVGTMSWTLTVIGGAKLFENKTCSKTVKVKGKKVCRKFKTVASATCTAKTTFPKSPNQVGMVRRSLTPPCTLNAAGRAAVTATNKESIIKGSLFFDRLYATTGKKSKVVGSKTVTLKNVKRTIVLKLGTKT